MCRGSVGKAEGVLVLVWVVGEGKGVEGQAVCGTG